MTPTERESIRAADDAQHRKKVDLYRADLDYHQLGRMAQHFEALEPPRRSNVLTSLALIIALVISVICGVALAVLIGRMVMDAITAVVAAQVMP